MAAPALKALLKKTIKSADIQQVAPTEIVAKGTPPKLAEVPVPESQAAKVIEPAQNTLEPATVPAAPPPKVETPAGTVPTAGVVPKVEAKVEAPQITAKELDEAVFDPNLQGGAAGKATEQLNFTKISDPDEIKAIEQTIAQSMKGQIDEARRGTITMEELDRLASDAGTQAETVKRIMTREIGELLPAENILAARKIMQASAVKLKELAGSINAGQASDEVKLEFRRQMAFHTEYTKQFMGARAEIGRALGAFRPIVGDPGLNTARLMEMADGMSGVKTEHMARILAQAEGTGEISKLARELIKPGVSDVLYEVWISSILSGVRTQMANMTGNVLFAGMNAAETALAARIGRVLPGADHVEVGEAHAQIYGYMSAFSDAMSFAKRAFKSGEAMDHVDRMETPQRRKAVSSETMKLYKDSENPFARMMAHAAEFTWVSAPVDFIGNVTRMMPERVMVPMDEFSKTMFTRGELSALAYREASKQARIQGLAPEQAQQLLKDLLESPPPEMAGMAADKARELTFQKVLGPKGQQAQSLLSNSPLRWIMPFPRTMMNIFNEGLVKRSPLGFLSQEVRADLKAGGARRDLALARLSLGTMTTMSVGMAVQSGKMTGGGPQDPQRRRVLQQQGWKPYSFIVQNPVSGESEYVPYLRAEPWAFAVATMANLTETMQELLADMEHDPDQDDALIQAMGSVVSAVGETLMDKTMFSGAADFMEALSGDSRQMIRYMTGQAAPLVPLDALRRDMAKFADPYMREAWDFTDRLKTATPGLSKTLPPRRDLLGEPIKHPRGHILGPVSIFPAGTKRNDMISQELTSLMEQSRRAPISMPRKTVEGMRLNSREYDIYVEIARKTGTIDGMTFPEAMMDTMTSSVYLNAPVDDRVEMLKNLQQSYDEMGRDELEAYDLKFNARISQYRTRQEMLGLQ